MTPISVILMNLYSAKLPPLVVQELERLEQENALLRGLLEAYIKELVGEVK